MKIENLKVYDLAESIVCSGYPMKINLNDKIDRIKSLENWLETPEYLMELVNNKELDLNEVHENTRKIIIKY